MDFLAHLVFGIWIYKLSGNFWIIPLTLIFDLDHIIDYFYSRRHQVHVKLPRIYQIAYRPRRPWFHSITMLLLILIPVSFFVPWEIVLIALAGHLLMDSIDKTGVWLLYPLIKKKFQGPLPVGYLYDDPQHPMHNKKSHIPSVVFILLFALLIVLNI